MGKQLKSFKKIANQIENGYVELVEFLKEHNRYIRTPHVDEERNGRDKIYGYTWDSSDDFVQWNCLGVRLNSEDEIEVLLSYWDTEDENDDLLWDNLRFGEVAYYATLINILETIHEYV